MSRQLNLMPAAAHRRQIASESLAVWWRVLAVVGMACAGGVGLQAWRCEDARQSRAAMEAQHAPIAQLRTDIRVLNSRIEKLTASQKLALELASKQPMMTLVGQIGQAAAFAGGELFVDSLQFERRPATAADPACQTLRLEGSARDNLSVTRFAEGLRQSELFGDVRLTSTGSRQVAKQAATAFEIECVF